MGNVVDYVRREFHGFAELPFGDVDSLVLAELSYMRLSGLVPAFGEARSVATVPIRELLRAENYDDMFVSNSSDMNEYRLALLRAVCESPRFRALRVGEYAERLSEREQQQFAAMTFDVGCGPVDSLYVAFRGTDGTLVGWKEDFNMAVRCPVPSQESAYRYVNSILDRSEGFLSSGDSPAVMLGGHSKGGNMAVYAAMRIAHDDIEVAGERARRLGLLPSLGGPVRGRNRRISRIFSHDGPGLPKSTVRGQAYRAIESRIRKTVPESSVVGMLLQSNAPVRIVKADAIGIMQHMGNSWQVAENGDFEQVDELTAGAQLIKRTLDGWLDTVSQEQRERHRPDLRDLRGGGIRQYRRFGGALDGFAAEDCGGGAQYRSGDARTHQGGDQGDSGQRGEGGARGLKRVECRGGLKRVPRRGYGRMQRLVGMVAEPHFGRFMCHDPRKGVKNGIVTHKCRTSDTRVPRK